MIDFMTGSSRSTKRSSYPFLATWLCLSILDRHCSSLIVACRGEPLKRPLSKIQSVSDLIKELKRESAKWAKTKGLNSFYWQNGYGDFSISPSHVDALKRYLANQEE